MKYMETYYNAQIEGSIYKLDNGKVSLVYHYYGNTAMKVTYDSPFEAIKALRKLTDHKLFSMHGTAVVE